MVETLTHVVNHLIEIFNLGAGDEDWIRDMFPHPENYTVLKYELINTGKVVDLLLVVHNWNETQPSDKVIEVYNALIPSFWIQWGEERETGELIAELIMDSKLVI